MSTNRALRFLRPWARVPPRASLSDAIVKISGSCWADKEETGRVEGQAYSIQGRDGSSGCDVLSRGGLDANNLQMFSYSNRANDIE